MRVEVEVEQLVLQVDGEAWKSSSSEWDWYTYERYLVLRSNIKSVVERPQAERNCHRPFLSNCLMTTRSALK